MAEFHVSSQKPEISHFNELLLSKWYEVSAVKSTAELSLMTLKSDAKLKERMTFGFKYDMINLVNFYQTTQKPENLTSMGSFCPNYIGLLKKYRGIIFHEIEEWCKIWINSELVVSKMSWGIGWTFIRPLKSEKLCFDELFLTKVHGIWHPPSQKDGGNNFFALAALYSGEPSWEEAIWGGCCFLVLRGGGGWGGVIWGLIVYIHL